MDKDATGSGDGTSWEDAYVDLSAALLSRNPFTEVWWRRYLFTGVIRASGFVLYLPILQFMEVFGSETQRDEREYVNHPTILSGDIGVTNDSSDNAYNVVTPSNGSLLDGFTVRDGNASQNYGDTGDQGCGVYADGDYL